MTPRRKLPLVTWVDPTTHQPVPLSITQTPAELPAGQSRVDFYATVTLNTIMQLPDKLKKQVQAVVGSWLELDSVGEFPGKRE